MKDGVLCTNSLAVRLLDRLYFCRPNTNIFFSPFEVAVALSLTMVGSSGTTAKQLGDLLKFEFYQGDVHLDLQTLIRQLWRYDSQYLSIRIFNGLFCRKGYRPDGDFCRFLYEKYRCIMKEVDFVENSEQVRREINDYIEEATDGKISNMLSPGAVTSMTRVALVSAVSLSVTWNDPFALNGKKHTFYMSHSETSEVQMMHRKDSFKFMSMKSEGLSAVEVPHKGGESSTVFIFFDRIGGLEEFGRRLSLDYLLGLRAHMETAPNVDLWIPHSKLNKNVNLRHTLYYMGVTDLFTEGADLEAMFGNTYNAYFSEIMHRCVVKLSTEGLVITNEEEAIEDEKDNEREEYNGNEVYDYIEQTKELNAVLDKPFLFYVIHAATSMILFIGLVKET